MRQTLSMNVNQQKYKITIETGLFLRIGELLSEQFPGRKIAVITDETVDALYHAPLSKQLDEAGIPWSMISLPPGEESKSFHTLPKIYSYLLDVQMTRDDIILAFGGGVIGDIAGFAASTFLRGVNLVLLPTTLMAMVDSSIGGKNGANLLEGKNLAGTFYQPKEVFIDPGFVRTLPDSILADGMAEVIKYGCVFDPDLFSDLIAKAIKGDGSGIESIIYRSCLVKKQIIEQDSHDMGVGMLLNFGHTLGHCIEDFYPEGTYTHGQAVSIGMYTTAIAGERLGITDPKTSALLRDLLDAYDLPHELRVKSDLPAIIETVHRDKKRRGYQLNLVLLEKIGKGFLYPLGKDEYGQFLGLYEPPENHD